MFTLRGARIIRQVGRSDCLCSKAFGLPPHDHDLVSHKRSPTEHYKTRRNDMKKNVALSFISLLHQPDTTLKDLHQFCTPDFVEHAQGINYSLQKLMDTHKEWECVMGNPTVLIHAAVSDGFGVGVHYTVRGVIRKGSTYLGQDISSRPYEMHYLSMFSFRSSTIASVCTRSDNMREVLGVPYKTEALWARPLYVKPAPLSVGKGKKIAGPSIEQRARATGLMG